MNWVWMIAVVIVAAYFAYQMLPAKGVKSIRAEELRKMLRDKKAGIQYVDVREPGEFQQGHIDGFRNIPLGQLRNRLGELDREKPVVVMCHSGRRSTRAARMLVKHGFPDVRNLSGGIVAWYARRGR